MILHFPLKIVGAVRDRDFRLLFGRVVSSVDARADLRFCDTIHDLYRVFTRPAPCDLVIVGDDAMDGLPQICIEELVDFVDPAPVALFSRCDDRDYLYAYVHCGCRWTMQFSRGEPHFKSVLLSARRARTAA